MAYNTKTRVYEVLNGKRRLMNVIESGSRFHSMPWTCTAQVRMTPDNQLRAAREIADAWRHNGNKPEARYVIEQDGKVVQ